jgi:flagellar hook-associated protein 2
MANISFTGLGSSIDFGIVRDAIIADRMKPIVQLQSRSANLSSRSDALKQLNSVLASLTNAADGLTDTSLGNGRSVTSSSNSTVTALATSAAAIGGYSLNVTRLATTLSQASKSYTSRTGPILAGGAGTATFELRKGGAADGVPITIDSSNNSLEGLRDAINAANAGVTAAIVDIGGDGTQNQLVLTSAATGAAGRVELVETSATGTGDDLTLRALNPPGATNDFSTLDSQVTINGLTITRPTNSISDAVAGITFKLQTTGQVNLTVGRSNDITTKLQAFVNAYNGVQDFVANQYKKDADGRPTGVLVGDPTLRLVQSQLRDALRAVSSDNGGSFSSLNDLGIGRDGNDKLTLNTDTLASKLDSNLTDVKALLSGAVGKTGLFDTINTQCDQLSDDVTGVVQHAITGYKTSIQTLNKSILDQTARINLLRDSLTKQFAVVDSAINQLNSQGSTLSTIIDSLKSKNS